jgi:hypothetical protein
MAGGGSDDHLVAASTTHMSIGGNAHFVRGGSFETAVRLRNHSKVRWPGCVYISHFQLPCAWFSGSPDGVVAQYDAFELATVVDPVTP